MTFTKSVNNRRLVLILLAMSFASFMSTTMVAVRILYSGRVSHTFLIWNLFLAWLPLLFAVAAFCLQKKQFLALSLGSLWLLFLPNAPYLVTDLVHLRPLHQVPLWYDAIMLFSFALIGLLLGFLSLFLMQTLVARHFGSATSWLFALTALALSGFGVYIGRFLRWNSWDLFLNPRSLLYDILMHLATPHLTVKTFVISGLFCAISVFAYVILVLLPQVAVLPEPSQEVRLFSSREEPGFSR